MVVSKIGVLAWGGAGFWTRNEAQPRQQIEMENTVENDGENLTALDVAAILTGG
ncbi:MAG: hypothetical protein R2941_24425 [Desulfobacterales bacterium]